MAFWGTEVKPGKPFTLKADSTRERLHISLATLGNGNNASELKSMVQCNVGNNSPVFLCSLFPKQSESCQLHLEFEESVDVIFSVIGPRSVHLTGYYLRSSTHYNDDHSESYGEDIADTETERSAGGDENEDGYEDSFINDDDDPQLITPSPVSSDGEAAEALLESKPRNKKAVCRRLRKKYQIQSDEDDNSQHHNLANGGTCVAVLDSESEDKLTISSLCKSAAWSTKSKAEENAQKETCQTLNKEVEDGGNGRTMEEQKGNIILDSEERRQPDQPDLILDYAEGDLENGAKPNKKKKKQSKKEKELEAGIEDDLYGGEVLKCDQAKQSERKVDQSSQIIDVKNEDDQRTGNYKQPDQPESFLCSSEVGLESSSQPKKKKKMRSKGDKELKAGSKNDSVLKCDQAKLSETKADQLGQDTDVKNEEDPRSVNYNQPDQHEALLRPTVLGLERSAMPKKKKKRLSREEKQIKARIGDDSVPNSETKADQSTQDVDLKNEEEQRTGNDKNILLAMPSDPQLLSSQFGLDNCLRPKRKRKTSGEDKTVGADSGITTNDIKMDKASQDEFKSDGLECDGSLQDEQNQSNFEQSVNENRSRKKKKKKKTRKTQENGEVLNMEESKNKSLIGIEEDNA